LKIGDQRLAREIGLLRPKIQKIKTPVHAENLNSANIDDEGRREPVASRAAKTSDGCPIGHERATRMSSLMTASRNRPSGSSAFKLSTTSVSMSLTGSRFSSDSAPRPFHHGIRRRGGTIFWTTLPVNVTAGSSRHTISPRPSSRERHHSTVRWISVFSPI
jgi:hypothetical protein